MGSELMLFQRDGEYISECIVDVILDACKSIEDFCEEQDIPIEELDIFLRAGSDYINGQI